MPQLANFVRQGNCESDTLFIFVAFGAVAIWSTAPLTIRLLTTVKRCSGVYFWSLLVTTWGLCIRQIGYITKSVAINCPWQLSQAMLQVGWVAMVSGFSMVLYSRLNIILHSQRTRRAVLTMIVFNGIVWHTSVSMISFGKVWAREAGRKDLVAAWQHVHDPFERVQIIMFTLQETIISFFYVRVAYQYLKGGFAQKCKAQRAMVLLLLVQVVIIAVDITMIAIDYMGYVTLKVSVHSFSYCLKLEMEFVVLNQLVELSKMGLPGIPSFQLAAPPDHLHHDVEMAAPKSPGMSVVRELSTRRYTQDSALDMESSKSTSSRGTLDFITIPQHLGSG